MDEREMIEEYEAQNAFHAEMTDEDYYRHELADEQVNDGVGLTPEDKEFVESFNEWYDKTFGGRE